MPEETDPYYLKRTGNWPIGKTGGDGGYLIASKRKLAKHAQKDRRSAEGQRRLRYAPRRVAVGRLRGYHLIDGNSAAGP